MRSMAIILVVYGHYGALPVTGLLESYLPLYSFHMPLFLFISGYLFHDFAARDYGRFAWRKTKHLALPLLGWNIVYAGIVTILNWREVTNFLPPTQEVWTFHNLFIEPFLCGHQYQLNASTWFVGMLYVSLLVYGLFHLAFKRLPEWASLIVYGGIAVAGLYGATLSHPYWVILPLHVSLALFFIHFGRCYALYIEPFLARWNGWWALIACLVLWFVVLRFGGTHYMMVWMNYDGCLITPLLAGAAGCMFWKKMSDGIARYVLPNKLERWISQGTWSVMTHHMFVRFLFNWVFVYLLNHDLAQQEWFRSTLWFQTPYGYFPIDMLFTVGLPVLWQCAFDKSKAYFAHLRTRL